MTVSLQTPSNSYLYAGSATFAFTFQVLQANDLVVTVDRIPKTLGVDYTASGIGSTVGGTISYTGPLTTGQNVTLRRVTVRQRATDYQTNGDFLSPTVNSDFDRLWQAIQESDAQMLRALLVPIGEQASVLPPALVRANKLLTFDALGNPVVVAPAAQDATSVSIALAALVAQLAAGFTQGTANSVPRNEQAKLSEIAFAPTDGGVLADWNGSTGTLNTSRLQAFFGECETLVKIAQVPPGYFLTGPLTLGNTSSASFRSSSNQGIGVYGITGADRQLSCFFADASATDLTLLTRHNLAGTTMRDFGVDGRGLAAVGIDLSWIGLGSQAPSTENVIERLYANNCRVTGIVLDNLYDSKISGIRSVGSPIGLSLIGGGGQLSLSESVLTGLLQLGAQNLSVDQVAILGGMDIKGNTNNRIAVTGCQIFPILSSVSIPAQKWQYAITTDDSGSLGANVSLTTCFIFGGTSGCIFGKFASGIEAENCTFHWGGGSARLFGPITGGNPTAPVFHFRNCDLSSDSGTGGPITHPPAVGTVILENCYVNGTYYLYYNSRDEVNFTPTLVGSTGTNAATTYVSHPV